jgi:hypothetical protein
LDINKDVFEKQLEDVMKRFMGEFDEALKALWPPFDYLKRTSTVSEAIRKNEFSAF